MNSNLFDIDTFGTDQLAVEFTSNILQSSTEYSIIGTDLNLVVQLWNEGARRLYGYEPDEVLGRLDISRVHLPEDIGACKIREIFDGALKDGHWEGALQQRRKNDEQFSTRITIMPRFDSSRCAIGFLLISRDISTELRLTAQLQCANSELREQALHRQTAEIALLLAHQELRKRACDMERDAAQMKLLVEMGEMLQSCVSSEELRQVAVRTLQKFFPADSGVIYLGDEKGTVVESFARWNGGNGLFKELFEPEDCWALRLGRQHSVGCDSSEIRCVHSRDNQGEGSICIPMTGLGQPLGLFHIVWADGTAAQTALHAEARRKLASALADTLALAISNVRLRERLKEQTIRDPLTRLYNRRYLEDSLDREISRARRSKSSIGIIMLDIDNFKEFNDAFGHVQGDQVLRSLGEYLKLNLRPGDIPSRYGGEEFTLILPGSSSAIVCERAESLRKKFQLVNPAFVHGPGKESRTISFSCGVAVFPEHGEGVMEILQAADQALYEAKRGGKDRVAVARASAKMLAQPAMQLASTIGTKTS